MKSFRWVLLGFVFALCQEVSAFGGDLPNIVIIVADDLGWRDVSFHGGEVRTPEIDRLATDGVQLDRFYVAPVCSPTRAGLMTGRYPIRYGLMRTVIPPWREGGLDIKEVTLADVLARAGYTHRGIFGKWHLGHSSIRYHPLRRGFTEFVGHYNGAIDYFTHKREDELDWHHDYEPNHEEGYTTDLIADAAVRFIRKRAGGEAPFFCYVPFNAPHGPFQAKKQYLGLYDHLEVLPGVWKGERQERQRARRILGAMIASLDASVGRILASIDESGVRENTLVLFFSDNGGVGGIGDNRPLNGAKGTVFEGGIRVVAAARWPGVIPGGRIVTSPLANIDVLPTVMRIVGLNEPTSQVLDGLDILDVLSGKKSDLRRDIYSYIGSAGEQDEQICYLTPEWKLIVRGPNVNDPACDDTKRRKLLFQIDKDPYEEQDLAADHPEVVTRMLEAAREFRALQPAHGVPPYEESREGFKAPREWAFPDR